MIENIRFSVVMSVYKNDNLIHFKQAINSLLEQTLKPAEIIITVDGPVPDDINDYLDELYKNNLFHINKLAINKGLPNALNSGIALTKFDLIARMDADDICFPNRFEKSLSFMFKYDLDIVGGQAIEFGENIDEIVSERKLPEKHKDIVNFMKFRNPFTHPSVLIRKKVYKQLGGYMNFPYFEDYELFVRAYLYGFKMGNLSDNILWFRLGTNYSEAIKRRWGYSYAKSEFKTYLNFYKLGFYNLKDFCIACLTKITIRILPFFLFKYIYFKISR